jgi:hypothetical protein
MSPYRVSADEHLKNLAPVNLMKWFPFNLVLTRRQVRAPPTYQQGPEKIQAEFGDYIAVIRRKGRRPAPRPHPRAGVKKNGHPKDAYRWF